MEECLASNCFDIRIPVDALFIAASRGRDAGNIFEHARTAGKARSRRRIPVANLSLHLQFRARRAMILIFRGLGATERSIVNVHARLSKRKSAGIFGVRFFLARVGGKLNETVADRPNYSRSRLDYEAALDPHSFDALPRYFRFTFDRLPRSRLFYASPRRWLGF